MVVVLDTCSVEHEPEPLIDAAVVADGFDARQTCYGYGRYHGVGGDEVR